MASKTQNLGLNQWELADSFVMADFNEDNAVLDAAVGIAAEQAREAISAASVLRYNLYQMMLQNYYEGIYTGYKKGILFQGFATSAGMSVAAGGLFDSSNYCLGLGKEYMASSITVTGGTSTFTNVTANTAFRYMSFCTSLAGTLSSVTVPLGYSTVNGYAAGSCQVQLLSCNQSTKKPTGAVLAVSAAQTVSDVTNTNYTFNIGYRLAAGTWYAIGVIPTATFSMRYTYYANNTTNPAWTSAFADADYGLGFTANIAPDDNTAANVTIAAALGQDYEKAVGFVRYSGVGTVSLSASNGTEVKTMIKKETRSAVNGLGASCTEAEFYLEDAPQTPNSAVALKLTAATTSSSTLRIYDFGGVFL